VELNAMTSDQFVSWLKHKLDVHGVKKIIPAGSELEKAYRRARKLAALQQAVNQALAAYQESEITMPDDLFVRVQEAVGSSDLPWDQVLWTIAQAEIDE
jgi:hypothetical protein